MIRTIVAASVASVLLLCAAPARAEAPFAFDATPGKLPKAVVPIDYDIAITPDIATKRFRGSETVSVTVRSAVTSFTVNAKQLTIASALLDGATKATIAFDAAKQLATLSWGKTVAPGAHRVAMVFAGTMGDAPEGLFYQKYRTPANVEKTMISTQFESTDARRMFPSWDEPSFRATFRLRATVPEKFTAVSNMPIVDTTEPKNGVKTVQFGRTPKMASYLVVLSAGEFEKIEGSADGVKIDVYATEGKRDSEEYALASAQKILSFYNTYFETKFPLPKLSLIAVPGGFGGAMENWGGITFNEQILLWDAKISPVTAKQRIFAVIAHEMAHQWFGDLVTMAWWDNLWLNEGFASWMGTKATDFFNPEWNVWQRANSEKGRALAADGRKTSHPIQQPIANETEADAAFDDITYLKGQSFLRMLEQYVGEEKFRAGIRSYMAEHKFSNTTTADLWKDLGTSSGQNIASFAAAWTEQAGYPLVTATASCATGARTLQLAQQRYFSDTAQTSAQLWQVPLAIAIGPDAPAYTLLATQNTSIPGGACGSPVVINGRNVGFYRVAYDAATQEILQKNFATLSVDDRLALLSDTSALAQSGRIPMGQALSLYSAVGADTNLAVWEQVRGSLATIEGLEIGTKGYAKFAEYARSVLRPAFVKLGGWDGPKGDASTEELRTGLIAGLGSYGDPETIAEARKRYALAKADPSKVPALDTFGAILGIVGRNADAATWEELHQSALKARTIAEKQRYYGAMLAATDPELAKKNLAISISGEIPPETASFGIRIVGAVAAANPRLAYDFYKANNVQLAKPLSQFERTLGATGLIGAFWNAAPAEDLEAFAKANTAPEAYPQIAKAMEQIQQRKAQQTRLVPQVDGYTEQLQLLRK